MKITQEALPLGVALAKGNRQAGILHIDITPDMCTLDRDTSYNLDIEFDFMLVNGIKLTVSDAWASVYQELIDGGEEPDMLITVNLYHTVNDPKTEAYTPMLILVDLTSVQELVDANEDFGDVEMTVGCRVGDSGMPPFTTSSADEGGLVLPINRTGAYIGELPSQPLPFTKGSESYLYPSAPPMV